MKSKLDYERESVECLRKIIARESKRCSDNSQKLRRLQSRSGFRQFSNNDSIHNYFFINEPSQPGSK